MNAREVACVIDESVAGLAHAAPAPRHAEPSAGIVDHEGSFLAPSARGVRVGDVWLPRAAIRDPCHVPWIERFDSFVVDEETAHTLLHVARAIDLAEPCLLEGPEGSSRAAAVLYLAAILGQPVLRCRLVPGGSGAVLFGGSIPRTRGSGPTYAWADGAVTRAMASGMWLLVEDLEYADRSILDRLASATERELTLPSNARSELAHPGFRLLATRTRPRATELTKTRNPSLSPWPAIRHVGLPSVDDLEATLTQWVTGEAPPLVVERVRYAASWRMPIVSCVASKPGFGAWLSTLARFHARACCAEPCAEGRAAYSRATLRSVLEYVGRYGVTKSRLSQAIARYYVNGLAPDDRSVVEALVDDAGFF